MAPFYIERASITDATREVAGPAASRCDNDERRCKDDKSEHAREVSAHFRRKSIRKFFHFQIDNALNSPYLLSFRPRIPQVLLCQAQCIHDGVSASD